MSASNTSDLRRAKREVIAVLAASRQVAARSRFLSFSYCFSFRRQAAALRHLLGTGACLALGLVLCGPASATITFTDKFNIRERIEHNPFGGLEDRIIVGASVSGDTGNVPPDFLTDPAPANIVSATAKHGNTGTTVNLSGPVAFFGDREALLNFTAFPALANGPWTVTANDANGATASVVVGGLGGAALVDLPFVSNVQSTGGLTPTISWVLPDLTSLVTPLSFIRLRLARTDSSLGFVPDGVTFFNSKLPSDATSFSIPGGVLTGDDYFARVMLIQNLGNGASNRSTVFKRFSSAPEPGTAALLLLGIAGLSLRRFCGHARRGS